MVNPSDLETRIATLAASPDLRGALATVRARAEAFRNRPVPIPRLKAMLSSDGGYCPEDGATLSFDPHRPEDHRCPRCGRDHRGSRHNLAWARYQHLWLAERLVDLATVAALEADAAAGEAAAAMLRDYASVYVELPNRDNVLGPTRLFFSTYQESIWVLNYLAAATLLRESDRLDQATRDAVDGVVEESAALIGEFNEGYSNRQTWHAAALTAIACWFNDEELATQSIEGRTGLLGHLADGFGEDGSWFEGENYHLFALRGLLTGLSWARAMGVDLTEDEEVAAHLRAALLAPSRTALPDCTFPARKDSRFGVSLAQPMYLELWEVGRVLAGDPDGRIAGWLQQLYQVPAQPAQLFESWLHEVGAAPPERRSRSDLSAWALLLMEDALPEGEPWEPGCVYLPSQGLAILRRDDRYVSLECGATGGGHGHPDRLHLSLHAGGVHWLPDFGTGSYVSPDLFWYRSTLSHNAPELDGRDQRFEAATCERFDVQGDWAWVQGRFREFERRVVTGPDYVLDVLTFAAPEPHQVELPWHLTGDIEVETPGRWVAESVSHPFLTRAERLEPEAEGPIVVRATAGERSLRLHLLIEGRLLRMVAPGVPGTGEAPFLLARGEGALVRCTAVLDTSGQVEEVSRDGERILVRHGQTDTHVPLLEGWQVATEGGEITLAGVMRQRALTTPLLVMDRPERPEARAVWVEHPPALDGSGEGFDTSEPLHLDTELHYRRSEEPYPGPDFFSAEAWLNWSDDFLYLMVDVRKDDPSFRPGDAPPSLLDNEPDDVHSDGLQVYLERNGRWLGFLVVPDAGGDGLRVHGIGAGRQDQVSGSWDLSDGGYRITLAIRLDAPLDPAEPLRFDLLVNEMHPDRTRRAGQLVWSGGGGWVYLRGDRADLEHAGNLELVG